MDKIQKAHGSVHWNITEQQCKSHATITEDLMGRFAEWVEDYGFGRMDGKWVIYQESGGIEYTTADLIQLFKETL